MERGNTKPLRLHLEGHCIQCAARQRFHEIVDRLIASNQPLERECIEEFKTLRRFLSGTDFEELQREIPSLTGTHHVDVMVVPANQSFVLEVHPCKEGPLQTPIVDMKGTKQEER